MNRVIRKTMRMRCKVNSAMSVKTILPLTLDIMHVETLLFVLESPSHSDTLLTRIWIAA